MKHVSEPEQDTFVPDNHVIADATLREMVVDKD